jgi:hypothetical protein
MLTFSFALYRPIHIKVATTTCHSSKEMNFKISKKRKLNAPPATFTDSEPTSECSRKICEDHEELALKFKNEGDEFAELGEFGPAIGKWKQSLMFRPGWAQVQESIAQGCLQLGEARIFEAVQFAVEATRNEPTWAPAWLTLSQAQIHQGELWLARTSALRAVELDLECETTRQHMKDMETTLRRAQLHFERGPHRDNEIIRQQLFGPSRLSSHSEKVTFGDTEFHSESAASSALDAVDEKFDEAPVRLVTSNKNPNTENYFGSGTALVQPSAITPNNYNNPTTSAEETQVLRDCWFLLPLSIIFSDIIARQPPLMYTYIINVFIASFAAVRISSSPSAILRTLHTSLPT